MATNGMCTAGRIKHHLAQYIDRPECTILFVGYQARGTLGRQILEGNPEVRLHGRLRLVRRGSSRSWASPATPTARRCWPGCGHFTSPPQQLFLTHGEEEAALALAEEVRSELHWNVTVPEYQQAVEWQGKAEGKRGKAVRRQPRGSS